MNRPIVRLYGLVVVLFALLVGFTSRWTIFQAAALRENPLNQRMRLEQKRVDRGPILASDGAVLARSVRAGEGYERRYPTGAEFAQAIGYSYVDLGRAGLELYRNAPLEGQTSSGLQTILDELQGRSDGGDEVVTTLDPRGPAGGAHRARRPRGRGRRARPAQRRRAGDGLDTELQPQRHALPGLREAVTEDPEAPLVNRATEYGYAPGSTFKIVTATAAIDTGRFHALLDAERAQRHPGLRRPAAERPGRKLRSAHADVGAGQIGQHRLGAGGRTGRQADDGALHAPLRVRRQAAAGLPRRRDVRQRRVRRANACWRRRARWSTWAGWASARTNCG